MASAVAVDLNSTDSGLAPPPPTSVSLRLSLGDPVVGAEVTGLSSVCHHTPVLVHVSSGLLSPTIGCQHKHVVAPFM